MMPAAKHFDPVLGIDIHLIQPPGPVPPVPIPHPFIGIIIDAFDYLPWIGGSVYVNGVMRAQAGTEAKGIPKHIPIGGIFVIPPSDEGEMFMGSATVEVDGDAFSYMALPLLTCHSVGIPPIPRLKRANENRSLLAPTTVVLPIPLGMPVLVGGPPTISLMALGMKLGFFMLGKVAKRIAKTDLFQKVQAKAAKKWDDIKKSIDSMRRGCGKAGEPVDVISGANVDDFLDYELPTTLLPFQWKRYYSSEFADVVGPLGRGFRHEYQRSLRKTERGLEYIDPEGSIVEFPPFEPNENEASNDGLILKKREQGWFEIRAQRGPRMLFQFQAGETETPLRSLREFDQFQELGYDRNGRWTGLSDALGNRITFDYSPGGQISRVKLSQGTDQGPLPEQVIASYRYRPSGELLEWTDALGHSARYEYDEQHRLNRKTDRRGYSYHYRYDDLGRCVHTWGDDGLYDVKLAFFPDLGLTETTWADGAKSQYFYDKGGRLTAIVDPFGNTRQFKISEDGYVVQDIDALGNVTELLYDQYGGHFERVDCHGYSSPPVHIQPWQQDPLQLTVPREPLQWEHGDMISAKSIRDVRSDDPVVKNFPVMLPVASQLAAQSVATPSETCDAMGRVTRRNYGDGTHETWKYDPNGNLLVHRDRAGGEWESSYKSWNLLDVETDPIGAQHKVEYNLREEVTSFEDAGGTKSDYVYDAKDRLVEVRRLGRVREQILYDAADNIIERQDGQGRSLAKYTIGAGNLDKVFELATGEKYYLDHDKRGRIVAAATDKYRIDREYNSFDRFLGERRLGKGVKHEYDSRTLTKTTFFNNFAVQYRHVGNQTVITDPAGGEHFLRSSFDGLIDREFSNGSREMSQYDSQGRCVRKVVLGPHSSQTWIREFLYNGTGNLTATNDNVNGDIGHDYDLAGKLIASHLPDGSAQIFEHDAARNLTAQPGLFGVSVVAGNQLGTANGDQFVYNDRDHLSERSGPSGTTRYTYNARDQLTRLVTDKLEWTAEYDPLGRRIKKSWNGNEVEFYWDEDRLAAETHNKGRTRFYVYDAPEARVPFMFIEYDSPKAVPKSGRCFFILADQRGCPIRVEDAAGQVVWQAVIDPYGTAHVQSGACVEMPLRFPGHYFDAETGLHDNRFRSYSPELGRYLQSDPAGLAGGINLYAYPSNPLTDVDVLGLHSLVSRIVKGVSDLGAKAEAAWKRFVEAPKAAKAAGMPTKDVRNLQKFCRDNNTIAVMRHSNPDSVPHQMAPDALPKPHAVYDLKTAKSGPNKGLVTNGQGGFDPNTNKFSDPKAQKNWEELEASGHKFDDQGVLRDKYGNAYHGDYDMQGVYKVDKDGKPVTDPNHPDHIDTNDPNFHDKMNDKVTPGREMIQHGANDQFIDPNTGMPGRNPNPNEKFLVVDQHGNTQTINSTKELEQYYNKNDIPWPYPTYQ